MTTFRPVLSLLRCLLSITMLTAAAQSQDVLTWHNDSNRTGWQGSETILTPSSVLAGFGKVFQYAVDGEVYAQPLAVSHVGAPNCPSPTPCAMVFIATEKDMLYGFNAASPTQIWSVDLAIKAGGTFLDCSGDLPPLPCAQNGSLLLKPNMGVTGTPVIDPVAYILYVVTIIQPPGDSSTSPQYYIHAVDIKTGNEMAHSPKQIIASVPGLAPDTKCATSGGGGTVNFDPAQHLQRAGLLLLNGIVYVGFAPADGEVANGWILGYTYDANGFHLAATFNSTPNGTGGGIWESGAGLAAGTTSNGNTYLFVPTGNGTFDHNPTGVDYGDSLLRLNPSDLTVSDFFTPYDQAIRCTGDKDFGSGGVLVFPNAFFHDQNGNLLNLLVLAEKESKLFFVNRDNLGQYSQLFPDHVVEEIVTPTPPKTEQGYLSTPAYWEWTSGGTTTRAIYYSAEVKEKPNSPPPLPLSMYQLSSSGLPVSGTPTASTATKFCGHGTTPSISAYGATPGTGILWAIEDSNTQNPNSCDGNFGKAILHAYKATNASSNLTELYNSSSESTGDPTTFATPTIFNGRVYMGTRGIGAQGEVDVFGLN